MTMEEPQIDYGELVQGFTELVFQEQLKADIDEKIGMQKKVADSVNSFLTLRGYFEFVPEGAAQNAVFALIHLYAIIRFRTRCSTAILKEYDDVSRKYAVIDEEMKEKQRIFEAGPNGFLNAATQVVTQTKGVLKVDTLNLEELVSTRMLTLKESVSTRMLTLNAFDNYRNSLREDWQLFYPKKPFPRPRENSGVAIHVKGNY